MKQMMPTLVMAPNREAFLKWINEHGIGPHAGYAYCSGLSSIKGIDRKVAVVQLPSWYENPAYDKICMSTMRQQGFTFHVE